MADRGTLLITLRADRPLARENLDQDDQDWLIGSPPCTAFSVWNYAINYPKMGQEKVRGAVDEGRTHLKFAVSLYLKRVLKGKHFLYKHPATALSLEKTIPSCL